MQVGARIDEEGVVVLDGDDVFLRRDVGGRFVLDLRRVDLNPVSLRIRIIGSYVGDDLVDVDEVYPV